MNGFYKPTHIFRSGWCHRLCPWSKFATAKTTSSQDPQPDSGTDLQKELDEVAARVFLGRVGVHFEELNFWKFWYQAIELSKNMFIHEFVPFDETSQNRPVYFLDAYGLDTFDEWMVLLAKEGWLLVTGNDGCCCCCWWWWWWRLLVSAWSLLLFYLVVMPQISWASTLFGGQARPGGLPSRLWLQRCCAAAIGTQVLWEQSWWKNGKSNRAPDFKRMSFPLVCDISIDCFIDFPLPWLREEGSCWNFVHICNVHTTDETSCHSLFVVMGLRHVYFFHGTWLAYHVY